MEKAHTAVQDDCAINADNLTFAYETGRPVLDEVAFQITQEETVGLVGPNGAGKTTLFLCLSGVLSLKKGMARVAGLDPAVAGDRRFLPSKVGIVFQNSDDQLFNATVFDEVAFGPLNLGLKNEEVKVRVERALAAVSMQGMEDSVPFHLSGGEKRRVALAGVLAMSPDILLLDEPTIFLDPRSRREFIELLHRISATKVIATHDLELVRETCQRILLLDGGKLVASGEPDRLLADADLMDKHGLEVPYSLRIAPFSS